VENHIGKFPVAATAPGRYSVGWVLPNQNALPGLYHIEFHRLADQEILAADIATALQNRVEGDSSFEFKFPVASLFSVTIDHAAGGFSGLPVRTEFLVLLALLSAYIALSYNRIFKQSKA